MGMFDRVYVNCWRCGERIELQSKSGDCILAEYTLDDVPADVIGGLAGDEGNCKKCGAGYKVVVRVSTWLSPTQDAPDLAKAEAEKWFDYGVSLGIANSDDDPPSAQREPLCGHSSGSK